MKLLILYCDKFQYHTTINTLEKYQTTDAGNCITDSIVAFIHVEATDSDDPDGIEKKMVKQLKWAAGKNNTNFIVLHSFSHLAESKAEPGITKYILDKAEQRLQHANYSTHQTPFGYFLDLNIQAPGHSLARIFKSF